MKAARLEFGHDECCEGTSVLGVRDGRPKEAVSQDWRAWVVGIYSASCVWLVGFARFTPGVWEYPEESG